MNYREILEKQLAVDYNCSLEDVRGKVNVISVLKEDANKRVIGEETTMLQIAGYGEKLLIAAHESLMDWCREELGNANAVWFTEPQNICRLNEKMKEFGQCVADLHHYYIPGNEMVHMEERFAASWYKGEEILQFKNDLRFGEALLFDEDTPDMVAVCAMEEDTILGMAGATADTKLMWQIGVNVTKEGQGKGVGTYVTTLLKDKVIEQGKVPFYGTVESHIKSQRVAIQSGFLPVFWELFTEER